MLSQIRSQAAYVKTLILSNSPNLPSELSKLADLYKTYVSTLPPETANLTLVLMTSYGAIQVKRKDIPNLLVATDPRMPMVVDYLARGQG